MKRKPNIEFVNYSEKLKDWKYMENFCFLPTIYTSTVLASQRHGYITRVLYFHWLWWMLGFEWRQRRED